MKHKRHIRKRWLAMRFNFTGLAVGIVFYGLALTPSLLPAPAWLSGVVAGVNFAVGYGIGVFLSCLWRRFVGKEFKVSIKQTAWKMLGVFSVLLAIAFAMWYVSWQSEMRGLVGQSPVSIVDAIIVIVTAFVSGLALVKIGRLAAFGVRYLNTHIDVRIYQKRHPFASAATFVLVGFLLAWFVLFNGFIILARGLYSQVNGWTDAGDNPPSSIYRSGGPKSLVAWDTLGREGRDFISGGPRHSELLELNDYPPEDPVRVYVGMESAPTVRRRAELAVKELERTGAFERQVLGVFTATGTGWIDPQSADSLEYIYNGGSAIVSIQYSYLPSWISFLADRELAITASRELFDAVYSKWSQLPETERPKLVVYGLSLGAYGTQGGFDGELDIQEHTDGALLVGSPGFSGLWQDFTDNREPNSPQRQPVYQGGKAVRFGADAGDLQKPRTNWQKPRIIYLQHASDPVVWWDFDLLWRRPDWLSEPRGPDVSPDMKWYPLVTFLQVTSNMLSATNVPNGHGHNYGDSVSDVWSDLTAPDDWDNKKADKLKKIISDYPTRSIIQFLDRDND